VLRPCRRLPDDKAYDGEADRTRIELGLSATATCALVRGVEASTVTRMDTRDDLLRRLCIPSGFNPSARYGGFDWHSSSITASALGALKRGLMCEHELGLHAVQKARHGQNEELSARNDLNNRRLECFAKGPGVKALIAEERGRSHQYGGRSGIRMGAVAVGPDKNAAFWQRDG
jgi:hypothetical protein